jgi:hypothetical protein
MMLLPTVLIVTGMIAGLAIVWSLGRYDRCPQPEARPRVVRNLALAGVTVMLLWYLVLLHLVGPVVRA